MKILVKKEAEGTGALSGSWAAVPTKQRKRRGEGGGGGWKRLEEAG